MQFTIVEPSYLEYFVIVALVLAVPVGLPLLLWLRRSPRNARDVLLTVARRPAGLLRRGADFVAWLVPATSLIGLQVLAMLAVIPFFSLLVANGSLDADENLTWLIAPVMAAAALLLRWMRAPRAAQDVLRIRERAPQRRR